MKTAIILSVCSLFLIGCVYAAVTGTYTITSAYTDTQCCPPKYCTITGTASPYAISCVFPSSGTQCTTDSTTGATNVGTMTFTSGTSYTVAFTTGNSGGGTINFANENAPVFTLNDYTTAACVATYKSAYLVGIGALMVASFMYLFI